MLDLYWGLLVLVLLALLLLVTAAWVGQRVPRAVATTGILIVMALSGLYVLTLWDNILMAQLLPVSNLIVLGNALPLAAAVVAGLAWPLIPGHVLRRLWLPTLLLGAGIYAAIEPLLGHAPHCLDVWDEDGICRQTDEKSCSAACAATLLAMHGIPATEQEMAQLCLTREGTRWQGIYRGLKLKTRGTPYDVEVFGGTVDDLRALTPGVLLLATGLDSHAPVDPIYQEEWGWRSGELHSVLLFEFVAYKQAKMADPGIGREPWTVQDLQVLYRGRGMRLVPR